MATWGGFAKVQILIQTHASPGVVTNTRLLLQNNVECVNVASVIGVNLK